MEVTISRGEVTAGLQPSDGKNVRASDFCTMVNVTKGYRVTFGPRMAKTIDITRV